MTLGNFADHHGVRIHYLDQEPSDPTGAPVVFVPSVVCAAEEYEEAARCFITRRFVVIDLRGRGASDAPRSGYSVDDLAGDIEAVLRVTGIEAFHLMTFSRGTTPALVAAFRRPDQVLSVSIGDYLPAEVALSPDFAEKMGATRWRGTPNFDRVPRRVLDAIQRESQPRDLVDDLGRLAVPVLVARGSKSDFVDDAAAARYRRAVPGIEVVTLEGSGHDLFRPSRAAYPELVLDFIARRVPGT
jgi:pimeloyl-ACP methyl ester carboxylesterase